MTSAATRSSAKPSHGAPSAANASPVVKAWTRYSFASAISARAQLEVAEDDGQGAGREQHGEHPALGAHRRCGREQRVARDLVGGKEDQHREPERRQVLQLVQAVGEVLRLARSELDPGEHCHGGGEVDEVVDQLGRHRQAAGGSGDHGMQRREQHVEPDRIPSPALDVHGAVSPVVTRARSA